MNFGLFLLFPTILNFANSDILQPPQPGEKQKIHSVDGKYRTCQELFENGYNESGVYPIHVHHSGHKRKIHVYCNSTENQSGTIILYRYYGKENFTRGFNDYRRGFGSTSTDYWVGLDNIIHIIATGQRVLTITMQDWLGNTRHARYQNFWLDPYPTYALHVSGFSGNVIDDLSYQNGREFATIDRVDPYGCSLHQKVGWWYNYCAYALLTGRYYYGGHYTPTGQFFDGLYWKDWTGFDYSLKFVSMSLSPN